MCDKLRTPRRPPSIFGARRGEPDPPQLAQATVRAAVGAASGLQTVSSHWVGTPNSKPHLMMARRTIVNADMRGAFSPTSAKGHKRKFR